MAGIEEDLRVLARSAESGVAALTRLVGEVNATLSELRGGERVTAIEIARLTGLSPAAVHRRLRKAGHPTGPGCRYTTEDVYSVFPETTGGE